MIWAVVFCAVAVAAAGVATLAGWLGGPGWWLVPGAVWFAISFGGAASAWAGLGPGVFGKGADGRLPLWSYALFGPFLIFGRAVLRAAGASGIGSAWDEVAEGLWLGRRPHPTDRGAFRERGFVAILDLAAEVGRSRGYTETEAYRSLPVLDHTGLQPEQLDAAVAFIASHRPDGPVYVHCALGIGRGASVAIAWLLHTGEANNVAEAEQRLLSRRRVALSTAQRRSLEAWWTGR